MKETSPGTSIPEDFSARQHGLGAPVEIPARVDEDADEEEEEDGRDDIHDGFCPRRTGGVDDVHPHMGAVVVAVACCRAVEDGEHEDHRLMAPVGRHAENITHHHLEGDDSNRKERHADHQLAHKDIGLIDSIYKCSKPFHNDLLIQLVLNDLGSI